MAGIGSPDKPAHVLIALEPEVASINCRKLKMNQVWPLHISFNFSSISKYIFKYAGKVVIKMRADSCMGREGGCRGRACARPLR